jgi:5-methylcytosine-specific restriction enzyme subunit McrC
MNRFFQALLSRFLRDNLPDYQVDEEFTLPRVLRYAEGWDSPRGHPPQLRPDFVVRRGASTTILDAKYRDLWEHRLPREMLHQLAVYAAVHPSQFATILYPTIAEDAREVRIELHEMTGGPLQATVSLRPVRLTRLKEHVLSGDGLVELRARQKFAHQLAFGEQ